MFVIGCGGSNRSASTNTSSSSANSSAQSSAQQQKETKESSAEIKWNTSEVDAQKNGNFTPAVKVLNKTDDMNAVAEDVDAAAVMQKPWEYYGKVIRVTGTVAVVANYPPDSKRAKQMGSPSKGASDVVVMVGHDTIVEFFLQGTTDLQKNAQATLMGYPIGRTQVENKVGGKFTHLIVVGK